MSSSSKSIFSFLAGAAAVAAAGVFLRSENGKKIKQSIVATIQKASKKTKENVNTDWINELSDSAIHNAKNFRSKMKF